MRYIPGHGPTDARIAFIGEAPGGEEELAGRPFVGPAGQELTRICHDAGLARNDCWVTNVARYRPPNNDLSAWIQPIKHGTPSAPDLIPFQGRLIKPFVKDHLLDLRKELQILQPNVIVPLGNYALWALTGESSISLWRGSILEAKMEGIEGMKVIPTYHPAGVLRNWPWRWDAVQDLRRVKDEALSPAIEYPKWNFTIRPSYDAVIATLEWLLARLNQGESLKLVADIETLPTSCQITCIGIGWSQLDALCIPFFCNEGDHSYWTAEQEVSIILLLRKILLHPLSKVVGQNFLYDSTFMSFVWGHKCIPARDTMIAQHVCYPGKEKSLDYIASIYCKFYRYWKEDGKEWRLKGNEDTLWSYNCQDCVYTWECDEVLQRVVEKLGLQEQYQFQMSLFPAVLDMMIRGVRIDPQHREHLADSIEKEMLQRETFLEQIVGHKLNTRSHPQLKAFFYSDLKIKPVLSRKTYGVSVDDEALDVIKKREPVLTPIVNAIQEHRSLGVFKGNIINARGPRDRMFSSFNIAGAETFRWSSSKNPFHWGINMQNIPKLQVDDPPDVQAISKLIRKLFLPDEGKVICEFDLERAEVYVSTWEGRDEKLKQLLRTRADIHAANAAVIGCSREMAKRFIHLTDNGGTPRAAAIVCSISVSAAESWQRRWFQEHPGTKEWQNRVSEQLIKTRILTNPFGYRKFFFDRSGTELKEGLAWIKQSVVGIVINKVLMEIHYTLPEVELLAQIHDSLVMQFDLNLVPKLLPKIHACFNRIVVPYEDPLVIPAECKLSTISWGDCVKEEEFMKGLQMDKFERVQMTQLV